MLNLTKKITACHQATADILPKTDIFKIFCLTKRIYICMYEMLRNDTTDIKNKIGRSI